MPKKCLICSCVLTKENSEYKSEYCKNCKANVDVDYKESKKRRKK